MKKVILHIVLLVCSSLAVNAESDSLFLQANDLYSQGMYEEAIATYQEILDSGYESPELYYNLGNSFFRSNKIGFAVLYYEKSLKTDPGYEPAKKNLEYVSLYLEDKLDSVPQLFIGRWIEEIYHIFPLTAWSIITIFLFFLFLMAMLLYIFAHRLVLKKIGFYIAVTAFLLDMFSLSAALDSHRKITSPDKAVILDSSVLVKSTPSDSGTDLFILHEGTTLKTDEEVGDWIEIRLVDGRIGWIQKKSLDII